MPPLLSARSAEPITKHSAPATKTNFQNLFVTKLPRNTTDADLMSVFADYQPVSAKVMLDAATGKSKGFGFVLFKSTEDGRRAYEATNSSVVRLGSQKFTLIMFPSNHDGRAASAESNALFIRNIPMNMDPNQVHHFLMGFGQLTYCAMRRDHYGQPVWVVYAEYDSIASATSALQHLHGNSSYFSGGAPILAKYADSEEAKRERRRRRVGTNASCPRGSRFVFPPPSNAVHPSAAPPFVPVCVSNAPLNHPCPAGPPQVNGVAGPYILMPPSFGASAYPMEELVAPNVGPSLGGAPYYPPQTPLGHQAKHAGYAPRIIPPSPREAAAPMRPPTHPAGAGFLQVPECRFPHYSNAPAGENTPTAVNPPVRVVGGDGAPRSGVDTSPVAPSAPLGLTSGNRKRACVTVRKPPPASVLVAEGGVMESSTRSSSIATAESPNILDSSSSSPVFVQSPLPSEPASNGVFPEADREVPPSLSLQWWAMQADAARSAPHASTPTALSRAAMASGVTPLSANDVYRIQVELPMDDQSLAARLGDSSRSGGFHGEPFHPPLPLLSRSNSNNPTAPTTPLSSGSRSYRHNPYNSLPSPGTLSNDSSFYGGTHGTPTASAMAVSPGQRPITPISISLPQPFRGLASQFDHIPQSSSTENLA